MARVLLAWELGGGLGHLQRLAIVGRALRARGHQTCFASRNLTRLTAVCRPGDEGLWFQAPLWLGQRAERPPSACYADLLCDTGFLDAAGLLGLVGGWRSLFAAIQPDLLVADHAPVSLLAAKGAPFATATVGTGFQAPPGLHPMPAFRTWDPPTPDRLAASEAAALETANQVLAAVGQPPLKRLHELLRVDEHWLACWPALDHYADHRPGGAVYVGPVFEEGGGLEPCWPPADALRWFAYLKAGHEGVERVLQTLSCGPAFTLAYVAGIGLEVTARWSSPHLTFVAQPVHVAKVLKQADAVICHAGMGLVSASLAAGRPLLLWPSNAEQRITADRVAALGAGLTLGRDPPVEAIAAAVRQLVADRSLRLQAQAFAAAQAVPSAAGSVDRLVARADALLAGRGMR